MNTISLLYPRPHLPELYPHRPISLPLHLSSWVGLVTIPKKPSTTMMYFAFPDPKAWISPSDHVLSAFQYENAPHQAKLSHEALGAAAAFYAAKKYEDHVAENGKPPSHALAKELM